MLNPNSLIGCAANESLYAYDIVADLGLTSRLRLCLDAGDPRCYPGSGQTFFDLSQSAGNFFIGATSGAEASDPAFTGNAGEPGAYFATDGGDYFRKAAANSTWMQNLHKANAAFCLIAVSMFDTNASDAVRYFGTYGGLATNVGIGFFMTSGNALGLSVADGSGALALSKTTTGSPLANQQNTWTFTAVTVDDFSGVGGFIWSQSLTLGSEGWVTSYATPSAANATYTAEIDALGNANSPTSAGCRRAVLLGFDSPSMATGLVPVTEIYNRLKPRFGF